ncbi:MAG: acyltransferase, partial [Bacteroidia bacterium]|nr:acyltransferase [Bacteroidia bacterium]
IMEQYRYFYLGLGLFTVLILYAFYWIHWPDARGWDLVLYRLIKSFNRWFWLLAILGFGKKYLSFNNAILKYANEAVYPFYILHQTIIIILAYPLISVNWPIGIKFVLLAVGTFVISGALYEFLIKRWVLTRVLFGLKSRSGASSVQILPQFR